MDPFRTRDAYVHWVCKSPQQHQKQHSRQQQPKTLTATKINAPLRSNSKNNLPQQHQKLPRSNSKKTAPPAATAKAAATKRQTHSNSKNKLSPAEQQQKKQHAPPHSNSKKAPQPKQDTPQRSNSKKMTPPCSNNKQKETPSRSNSNSKKQHQQKRNPTHPAVHMPPCSPTGQLNPRHAGAYGHRGRNGFFRVRRQSRRLRAAMILLSHRRIV